MLLLLLLLLLLELQMRSAEANLLLLKLKLRVDPLYLRIVVVYKLLYGQEGSISELFCHLRINFLDRLQVVHVDVLIAISLEHVTGYLTPFEASRMDEVAVFSASAAIRTVVVAARHCSEVTRLDQLVLLEDSLLGGHLIELDHLESFLFVELLEFLNLFISKRDEHLRCLT